MTGKVYTFLGKLTAKCYIDNIIYYNKSNIVRAPLEAALILYVVECYILFTDIFLNKAPSASQIMIMFFFPVLFSLITCVIYSIVVMIYVVCKINNYADCIIECNKYNTVNDKLNRIDSVFKRHFLFIHILGTFSYTLVALVVSNLFLRISDADFKMNEVNVVITLTIVGFLSGLLWNIMGYWSDNTVDWTKVYKDLKPNNDNEYIIRKFGYYIKYVVLNFAIVLSIVGSALLVLIKLHADFIENVGDAQVYYLFITIFFAIFLIYIKQMYNLFYKAKVKKKAVFFTLKGFLEKDSSS